MSEVIGIITSKGGVGKTTTSVNLAASLSLLNKKTLLIDFDPQSNATLGVGIKRASIIGNSIYDVMCDKKTLRDIIQKVDSLDNLYIAPANQSLGSVQKEYYTNTRNVGKLLYSNIESIKDEFDYIIVDSAPTVGPIFFIVLNSVKSVIVPVQCEYLSLDGTVQLLGNIKKHKKNNSSLNVRGFLPTMFTSRNRLSSEVLSDLQSNSIFNFFEDKEGIIVIPRTIKLAECFARHMPICLYDSRSPGHIAYMRLAQHLIANK